MNFDAQRIAQAFMELSHTNLQVRDKANKDIIDFQSSPQAWIVSRDFLTSQYNDTLQFLGAQILYNKTKQELKNFSSDQKIELRQFIFETIFSSFDKLGTLALKQLCGCAAIIGLQMLLNEWKSFISDLFSYADTSQQKLLIALEILSNLNGELKQKNFDQNLRAEVEKNLHGIGDQMTETLYRIITTPTNDQTIVLKAVECLETWAQMCAIEILHFPELIDVLMKCLNEPKVAIRAIRALTEGIKNSDYPNQLLNCSAQQFQSVIPDKGKLSIQKLIELLFNLKSTFKDLEPSICYELSDLVTHIGVGFHPYIFEAGYLKVIIEFLLLCTAHSSRKISSNTFEYWNFLRGEIRNSDRLDELMNPNSNYIPEACVSIFQIVAERCKAKSLKLIHYQEMEANVSNVEKGEYEIFEEDKDSDDYDQTEITLQDYRTLAGEVIYSSCAVLETLKGEQGSNAIFSLVIPLLSPEYVSSQGIDLNNPNLRKDYLLACEAAIFAARSTLNPSENESPNKYVLEILINIIKLPKEGILARGVLYYIKEVSDQIAFIPEYINPIFEYCLSENQDPILTLTISECLCALSKVASTNINYETLEKIAKFMENSIFLVEDSKKNMECISAVFSISKNISDEDVKIKFIKKAFQSVEQKFQVFTQSLDKNNIALLQKPSIKSDALKLFTTFANILKGFETQYNDNMHKMSREIDETAVPFIQRNIDYICAYLSLFNQIEEFITHFALIIKTSVRICRQKLEKFYQKIVESTVSTFAALPLKNYQLLDTFITIIFNFECSDEQKKWLHQNFSKFNEFVINLLSSQIEPNVAFKWMDVLRGIYNIYRDFFFSLPELEGIINTFLKILYESSKIPTVFKKSAEVINLLIGTKETIQHPIVAKHIPRILEIAFAVLPEIDSSIAYALAPIVSSILTGIENQEALINLFLSSLNYHKYNNVSEQEKKTFLEALYTYKENPKVLSLILKSLAEYVQDPVKNFNSMSHIHEKLLEKARS